MHTHPIAKPVGGGGTFKSMMHKKVFHRIASAFKTTPLVLALLLTFGLSYAYAAWSEPTATPPGGNVAAPINTGSAAQTKTGTLTVGGLALPAGATINGSGSNSTYGAFTVQGSKNGWSGVNFKDASGSNSGTLMMHPWYSGFYNATDNQWRMYVTDGGASSMGTVEANDFCTSSGKCLSTAGGSGNVASYNNLPSGAMAGYCNTYSGVAIPPAIITSTPNSYSSGYGPFCGCSSGWTIVMTGAMTSTNYIDCNGNGESGSCPTYSYYSCVKN